MSSATFLDRHLNPRDQQRANGGAYVRPGRGPGYAQVQATPQYIGDAASEMHARRATTASWASTIALILCGLLAAGLLATAISYATSRSGIISDIDGIQDNITDIQNNITVVGQGMVSTGTVKADVVCPTVLLHEVDGPLPSTHEMHHLQGPPPPDPPAPISAPLDVVADGDLGAAVTPAASGLQIRSVISPTSIVDRGSGVKWVQLGEPEPTFYFDEFLPGDVPPFDGEEVAAVFSIDASALPAGVASVIVDLELDVSTETNYDFVRVFKNGEQIPGAEYSGWVSPEQPFISATITDVTIGPFDSIEVRFSKDVVFLGGLDYALTRATNMRFVMATTPLQTTLETDLTGYIGKRIRVCSLDGDVHNISAAPNAFNYESTSWDAIRFQQGAMCCVEFTALSATKLDVTSGISPKCALVCNGAFCLDPNAPEESNSLIGDWLMRDHATTQEYWAAMIRVEPDGNQLKLTRYSGSPFWNIREWSGVDESRITTPGAFPGGVIQRQETPNVIGDGEMTMGTVIRSPAITGTFRVQVDGQTALMGASEVRYGPSNFGAYTKNPLGSIKVVPSDQSPDVSVGYDSNSLVNQFREYAAITQTMYHPQMQDGLVSSIYPGEMEARALLEKIIAEGDGTYTSNVTDVWPSFQDCIYFCGAGGISRTTSIFTDTFTEATNGVRISISGFGTGSDPSSPYAVLNGNHRVKRGGERSLAFRDLKEIYLPTHYKHDDHRYMINIDVDTTSIRTAGRFYNPEVDGVATVTVEYLPVTESMAPGDYFAAIHRWIVKVVFQIHTFTSFPVAFNHDAFETFDALHFDAENFGAEVDYGDTRFGFPVNLGGTRSTDFSGLTNDKYEQVQVEGASATESPYKTPIENYLSEAYNLWWAIDPNSASNPDDVTGQLVSTYGYNSDGSRFMFTYAPVGDTPTFPYPGAPQAADGTSWSIVSNFGGTGPLDRAMTFGRVRPELVSEETAYIFVPDEVQGDPALLMENQLFYPDGSQGYPDMSDFKTGVYTYRMSIVMEKLMSLSPTRIILDSRANSGGDPDQTLAIGTFMGGDRTSLSRNVYSRRVGYGHDPLRTGEERLNGGAVLSAPGTDAYLASAQLDKINVARAAELFPSSMFQGAGKRVTIITSTRSWSAGDTFPWYFLGDDPSDSRNMGADVTLEIIGNIDGRLSGASVAQPYSLTVTPDTIFNNLGQKESYTTSTAENTDTFQKPGYPPMVNQHPALAPDLLLSAFVGDSHWVDEGIITPYPDPPLPGWTAAGAVQEITQVDCVAGASVNQNGTFTVSSVTTTYTVWYNVDGAGGPSGANPVEVAIASGDSADAVTIATVNAIGPLGDFFVEFVDTDSFTIRNKIAGAVAASAEVDSGHTVSQTQASASGVVGEVLTSDTSTWRDRWLEEAIRF